MTKKVCNAIIVFLLVNLSILMISACKAKFAYTPSNISRSSPTADCRIIQHAMGETCVPVNPQRLIVTDEMTLDLVLTLGLKPIAVGWADESPSKKPYFQRKAEGVDFIGMPHNPNFEKLVKLHPDLILGYNFGQNYKLLQHIAPTVLLETAAQTWQDNLRNLGEILGKTEKASQALTQYQQKVEKLRRVMGNELGKTEICLIRFFKGNIIFLQTRFSFPGTILKDVGFAIGAKVEHLMTSPTQNDIQINMERLDLLDADVLFVILDSKAEQDLKKLSQTQLWQLLKAFKNNRIYTVNQSYWAWGNMFAANAVLDDLLKYLVKSR